MRGLVIATAIVVASAGLACGGGGKRAIPTVPTPPQALEIWARTLDALEQVQSVRMERDMSQDESNVRENVVFPRGGVPSNRDYTPWRPPMLLPAFPPYGFGGDARPPSYTNAHLLGEQQIDGKPHWVLSLDGVESGIDTVRYFTAKVWIARDSHLIRRVEDRTTRGEGCCGAPEPGLNAVIDYTEYQLGTPSTQTATPMPTPSPSPASLSISPTSGPCDGTVTLTGHGLAPYATIAVYVQPSSVSERGDVEGARVPNAQADARGDVSIQLQLADPWCAAPEVMIWYTIQVHVQVSTPEDVQLFDLLYEVSPCTPLISLERYGHGYCFNLGGLLTPSPTPPTISP